MKTLAAAAAMLCLAACVAPPQGRPSTDDREVPALRPVAAPPLTGMAESVAEQIEARFDAVARERDRSPRDATPDARGYGELGMVLLGAKYFDAAEPALLNAATLDAADMR